jgi:ribose 1,5-bisphosphate isomerase
MDQKVDKAYEDIRSMRVRGALDIALAAARTLDVVVSSDAKNTDELIAKLKEAGEKLKSARPSAVSLPNSVDFILHAAKKNRHLALSEFRKRTSAGIRSFIADQENALVRISEMGSRLIEHDHVIFTHCNSDTVTTILKKAWDDGKRFTVVCTETRPRYQGHLTAKALSEHGIPVTLIVDSAAHLLMKELKADKVIVGADTVYANGDMVNKIGTSLMALCAKEMDIDFVVATESIKFCPQSLLGSRVDIEYRDPSEVVEKDKLPNVKVLNPAFDVTSASCIDVFVTEFGVIPPAAVYQLLREKFGWELDL